MKCVFDEMDRMYEEMTKMPEGKDKEEAKAAVELMAKNMDRALITAFCG